MSEIKLTYLLAYLPIEVSNEKTLAQGSVLYEQLLSSIPYSTLCPIHNSMFMLFVHWIIYQLLWSKIDFFLEIYIISFSLYIIFKRF